MLDIFICGRYLSLSVLSEVEISLNQVLSWLIFVLGVGALKNMLALCFSEYPFLYSCVQSLRD